MGLELKMSQTSGSELATFVYQMNNNEEWMVDVIVCNDLHIIVCPH